MNERSDILIENSYYESTIHVSQNQLSSSIVNNRPSFSTKSVDDVKSSILALSNISSSLCSRMLINMHLPTLEKNLSTVSSFLSISLIDNNICILRDFLWRLEIFW